MESYNSPLPKPKKSEMKFELRTWFYVCVCTYASDFCQGQLGKQLVNYWFFSWLTSWANAQMATSALSRGGGAEGKQQPSEWVKGLSNSDRWGEGRALYAAKGLWSWLPPPPPSCPACPSPNQVLLPPFQLSRDPHQQAAAAAPWRCRGSSPGSYGRQRRAFWQSEE